MAVSLSYKKGVFYCATDFATRKIPEDAGFQFIENKWQTESHHIAARLREFADPWTEKYFKRFEIRVSPWSGRVPYPPDLTPKDFQLVTSRFALARNASYIAADPGVGKAIMAALITNAIAEHTFDATGFLTIYICPPYLSRNAEEEFTKWQAREYGVFRFDGIAGLLPTDGLIILPDNVLGRPEVFQEVQDILGQAKSWQMPTNLIVDEAHRFKSLDADRTGGLLKLVPAFDRVTYMSGTPLRNARPIELFPILKTSAWNEIEHRDLIEFGTRYCEARLVTNQFGSEWDFKGAANLDEFFGRIKEKFMVRIPKSVLGLKGKREEIVVLEDDMPAKLLPLERKILEHHSPEDLAEGRFLRERGKDPEEDSIPIGTYQRLIGQAKLKPYWQFLKAFLEETDEPLLIFAYHTEVIDHLAHMIAGAGFEVPFVITGATPMEARHRMVREFQSGKRRIFLLQRDAGGEGLTLTRAKFVDLLEPSWVDGQNTQCGDRADRFGQTELVLIRYFVYRNSLDKRTVEAGIRKREITQKL